MTAAKTPTEQAPEPPATLLAALLAVQAEMPKLHKDSEAEVVTQKGKYTYKYLTLDTLMDQILPVLNRNGLVWLTLPGRDEHGLVLRYRMIHAATSDAIEGVMPLMLKASDPQAQGSAITYARRYSLMALLGLAADEDDDGAAAKAAAEAAAAESARAEAARNGPRPLAPESRQKVLDAITAAKQNPDLLLAAVGADSAEAMTADHARQIRVLLDGSANGGGS